MNYRAFPFLLSFSSNPKRELFLLLGVAVFPAHGVFCHDPLLSVLFGVNTVNQLAVSNRFTQGTFTQAPDTVTKARGIQK